MVPGVDLQLVIVVYPDHTHLLFVVSSIYTCKGFEFVPGYQIQLFLVFALIPLREIKMIAFHTACSLSIMRVSFWFLVSLPRSSMC